MQPQQGKPHRRAIVRTSVSVVALLVAPAAASPPPGSSDAESRRVVILNGADPSLPAFIAVDRGVREAIVAGRTTPPSVHAETLDMYRFPQAEIDGDVVALLRKKYRGLRVDVIVAASEIALDFAERHRADIWPEAAIVFHSVSEANLQKAGLDPRTIGVPVRLEYEATLDLALKLRPATRRVVVVAGTAQPDRTNLALARRALERFAGTLEIQYLVGLTVADASAALQALPDDAAVLFLTVFRDGAGTPLVPRDVLTQVAAASRAPVFGVFETYLGDGIVAGSIASYVNQGRRAGELAVRVLNGEAPSVIGIQAPTTSACIADAQALRRWGIDASLLPADCDVRFREETIWDRYRRQIPATLAVFLVQSALIIALLLNRRRLRQARTTIREELGRRRQAETMATRLHSQLARFGRERSLGAIATAISHEINQPLIAIQNYAQAAKRRLQDNVDDKSKPIELFAKIEGQAERAGAVTQRVRTLVSTREVKLVPVALFPLLEEVVRIMQPETGNLGCRFELASAAALPAVRADPLQVQLVLVNLLRNAMDSVCSSDRYDRRVSIDARTSDGGEVQVSVTDWGVGISPDRAADIFEPLYSGSSDGMGMGLAIARTICPAISRGPAGEGCRRQPHSRPHHLEPDHRGQAEGRARHYERQDQA
jgi:signal transduction histidine kinase